MRIGELAARTGVSVRMLRYYEQQGLLTSARSASGQRTYSDAEPGRVALPRTLFEAGLSSRSIASVLPCSDTPGPESSLAAHAAMSRERDRIDDSIARLASAREALESLIAANAEHYRSHFAESAGA